MEGLQEDTIAPRAAKHIRQGSIKSDGGTGNKGGHAPMNPRNGKGKAAAPTKPTQ